MSPRKTKGVSAETRPPEEDVTPELLAIAHASPRITWRRYVVADERRAKKAMSLAARGMDDVLGCEAWERQDGTCRVAVADFTALCERDGLEAKSVWRQLSVGGRWVLDETKQWMIATHLVTPRHEAAMSIAVAIVLGKRSGASRGQKARQQKAAAPANEQSVRDGAEPPAGDEQPVHFEPEQTVHEEWPAEPEAAPTFDSDQDRNALPDNAFDDLRTDRSTACSIEQTVEQSRESSTPVPSEHGVEPSGAASAAAASAAGGSAAAPVALGARLDLLPEPDRQPARRPGRDVNIRALLAEQNIATFTAFAPPPADWADADVRALLERLAALGTGVDVEGACYRQFAMLQKAKGPEGHMPLLAEVRALLAGAEHRDGLFAHPELIPIAVALALHGANAMERAVAPLVLRAIAMFVARELPTVLDAQARWELASTITCEIATGRRHASVALLPCDNPEAPERLMGYRVRSESAAA